jgi:hypothetical protein
MLSLGGSKSRARQDTKNSWAAIDIEAKKRLIMRLTEQVHRWSAQVEWE